LVAKGGNRDVGEAYYDSWTTILEKYGLIPEAINYADSSVVDPGNALRPEYPNSSFDLWFLTHDDKYRRTGFAYFQALREKCRIADGYTTLKDVRSQSLTYDDYFPAYSFSENFKYLYLMFADAPRFDATRYYLNTEGKVMRGLKKA
jgi:mannosyl-oligosaccharide alpha-1,2-mannosidase